LRRSSLTVVVLHELAHASGHPTRLNRDLSGGFGSAAYAKEELRAELTSVAVGSMIGLPCDIPNHASYLQSWIAVLKQDRREIFHAAAEAQRMADYILGFHPDYAETPVESSNAEDDSAPAGGMADRVVFRSGQSDAALFAPT
jgi:antirestriction protein ArdC